MPRARTSPARTGPSLREIRKLAARRRLLATARAVFEERGYGAATVEDIIEAAGTSRATFYAHFGSKGQLIAEIATGLRSEVDAIWARLDDALAARSRQGVREWMSLAIEWYVQHARLLPAWQEAHGADPFFALLAKAFFDELPTLVPRYLDACPAAEREAAATRVRLLMVQLGAYFTWVDPAATSVEERELLAAELTEIWFPALLRRPA